ncbi:FtsZ/tubulin family protein [Desulfosudis oleivorans]|uniref:Uncharacterized protein n=1 Tax=Desulfosudis oleivorans (strain DSM 6200 / JCM 39069 / Hxd3) TaxID=96561 RepID=A8ZS54_DESOH|nr:hypothetical protein [Desulfosudis oleivorans]ABW66072.1 hypothetical protein Dole_0262 [Desulfosudis oleivorans Hxd3]
MTTTRTISRCDFLLNALAACAGTVLPLSLSAPSPTDSLAPSPRPIEIKRLAPMTHPDDSFKTTVFCMGRPGLYAVSRMVHRFGHIDRNVDYLFVDTHDTEDTNLYLPEATRTLLTDLLAESHLALIVADTERGIPEALRTQFAEWRRQSSNMTVTFCLAPAAPANARQPVWTRQPNDVIVNVPATPADTTALMPYAIFGLCHPVYYPGLVGLDLDDIKTVLSRTGGIRFGMATAVGENRPATAMRKALKQVYAGIPPSAVQTGLLAFITTNDEDDLSFEDLTEAADLLHEALRPFDNAEYTWAHRVTPSVKKGEVLVTVYAG